MVSPAQQGSLVAVVYAGEFDLQFAADDFAVFDFHVLPPAVFMQPPAPVIEQTVGVFGIGFDFQPAFDSEYAFDVAHGHPLRGVAHAGGLKRRFAVLLPAWQRPE